MALPNSLDEVMVGSILSVHVQNFMCHENFKVDFTKRVTFIVGRNGSGKSAILTALVVGLGGKASETNRGKNVQCQLLPTNAKAVNAIVSSLNIQVNNPISVLNQDDAREFSIKMDPRKLYSLFMRATRLDVTEQNYNKALAICKSTKESWERKNKSCMDLENEYNKWQKLYEQMQSRKDIEKRVKSLKLELFWSEVAEAESDVATIRDHCVKQRAKCAKMESTLQTMEQALGGAAAEAWKARLEERKAQKAALEQQLRPLERDAQDARHAHGEAAATVKRCRDMLERERRRVRDYEQEIQSGGAAAQRAELAERAERCRAAAEEARARLATLRNDAEQARADHERRAAAAERPHAERSRLNARLGQRRQELRELSARGGDSLAVYGAAMSELCQRVRAAAERGHFSAPPRGPVGQYIKVRERQWGGTLEHIIGGLMSSFCVNSPEDSTKLFKIMDQVWRGDNKPSVTCSKFFSRQHDVRDTSARAPPHRSALEALHVEDPVVANFLIDNLALERVLLVPDHDEAVRLAESVERVPRNCGKIVTQDCSEYHPAPDYRMYGGRARAARFLHLDTDERMRQLGAEIQELEAELQRLDVRLQGLAAEQRHSAQAKDAAERALRAMGAELLRREADENAAVAALETLQAPQQAVLDDELKASKQRAHELSQKLDELERGAATHKRQVERLDAQMSELKAQVARANDDCRKLSEEISQKEMEMDRGAAERRGVQQRLGEERAKLEKLEDIVRSKEEAVAGRISAARGPRIDRPRSKDVINNLLAQNKREIGLLSQASVSREEVERERATAETNYRRTQQMLDTLRVSISRITNMATDHKEFCVSLKKSISRNIGINFMATLTTRGYEGHLRFDHRDDTLLLEMSAREGARGVRSTASLSGGERSFTSMALITSLWDCVDLPFYFMDEFDVFMDKVHQQTSVDLLLEMAARLAGRQFVFLTPHALGLALDNAPLPIEVVTLGDPER
ncbi:structural maintenance of chromosomes protein 6 isoform X2 [Bicyclus anynana]|uniref:Structural maintenance of chromosomes protein 6 isoform X2 n=1 Tax=Bicyclus anynana TaxID=110368 RepID=A0ABM3LJX2_BICAN|nr:structural maintenance of chromosomes protein 6 isoform X2 [Bicyclus anynana]